ncbi:preprotein translocase subunit SecY [Candidatus Micrarchaeota archaeon]|nr:preprotein translocase subunit SecY [Candidatus Micrarchaeota archaeon]
MSWLQSLAPIINNLPEVKSPIRAPSLKEKLLWTGAILLLFYILGQIYPLGVDASRLVRFERLEILLGSRTGTLITTGIGPIVLASIFLQLAVGSKLINIDLSQQENKKLFQGLQKLLAIGLSIIEGFIYAKSIVVSTDAATPALYAANMVLGFATPGQLAIAAQLALGSIMLLYMDEVTQKYGIGSGISLFIAAGVTQAVFIGAFSIASEGTAIAGLIPQAFIEVFGGNVATAFWAIVPILFTIGVFLVVVYAEGMRIELPLSYGGARGLGARYPIKFLYVSVIPVILATAVLLNIQVFGLFLFNAGMPIFGNYQNNQPVDGLAYFTTALPSPLLIVGGYPAYLAFISNPREILHIVTYGIALVSLCMVFGWFWIESTGASAANVAQQLEKTGLQIPGFRQDTRVTERILNRYIPVITVLGSLFVGLLAWFADITGALGTGTGILLTVGVLYRFYEDLAKQQVFELYPALKRVVQ